MKSFFLIAMLLLPSATLACWAPCPEGKTCYFVDVWDSPEQLAKMAEADGGQACPPGAAVMGQWSTGQAYQFSCVNGKTEVTQTSPGKSMRVKGEEASDPSDEDIAAAAEPGNAIPDFTRVVAKCNNQGSCLEAHKELEELAGLNAPGHH